MSVKYFPNVKMKDEISSKEPQLKTLFREGQLIVNTGGLNAGQHIAFHPEGLVVYTFLEGKGRMLADEERLELGPGTTIIVQAGTRCGIDAETPLTFIAVRVSEPDPLTLEDPLKDQIPGAPFPFRTGDPQARQVKNTIEEQSKALKKAFQYIIQKDFYGGHKYRGDYLVAYSIEKARKVTYSGEGHPLWQATHEDNAHIGIAVHDENDLHFVSGLIVRVTVLDHHGIICGSYDPPLVRRPNYQHYGRNWTLPGDGKYTLHIHIETPAALSWNKNTERAYANPVEVDFQNVAIITGQASR